MDGTIKPLHPVVEEFRVLIENDPVLFMGFHQMFEQVPTKPPYNNDPSGKPQVRDYKLMLSLFDHIINEAPDYAKVNAQFKKLLNTWCQYLASSNSCSVLNTDDNGWFGAEASAAMPGFLQTYKCDPDAPHYGFKSFDEFFVREFRDGVRPIEGPGPEFITSACESFVYCRVTHVQERDTFWVKGKQYSLADMLHHDVYLPKFVGGTIYQAFLSVATYHRWHAPVDGVIDRIEMIPGNYYAESPAVGFDPLGPVTGPAFMTAMATRALVFIRADNKEIGLMYFMAVRMTEISSCEVTVKPGQKVKKGEQIGMFHFDFGGSTHCLIFRPETKLTFNPDVNVDDKVLLNSIVAIVNPS